MSKIKNIISVALFAVLFLSVSIICLLKPADEYSDSERRYLAQLPEFTTETIFTGDFMEGFEEYTADQFPKRDDLRAVKAFFTTKLLKKLDNNGLFTADGHVSKIDSEESEAMINHSAERFDYIYKTYLEGKTDKIYLSIVPDKNFVLAQKNGYPSLDYKAFTEKIKNKTEYMEYIDIFPFLSLDDYYTTDTHWKQESIVDIAENIAQAMGTDVSAEYTVNTLNVPFYGVYTGQLALPVKPDEIKYLTNDTLKNCTVSYYDTGMPKKGDMYNMKKADSKDPYEMYLSGVAPLITIENPNSKTEKKLVMFRDSYGSSIAPLFAEGYKKITLVDTRYMESSFIGNFVDFDECDVLFLYSTSLLNNSLALR